MKWCSLWENFQNRFNHHHLADTSTLSPMLNDGKSENGAFSLKKVTVSSFHDRYEKITKKLVAITISVIQLSVSNVKGWENGYFRPV